MSRPVGPIRPVRMIRPAQLMLSALLMMALLSVVAPAFAQGSGPDHPQAGKGSTPEHGTLSTFPWEKIDAYTGGVVLAHQDLVMPGPAGFNVVVSRTYNSKDGGWRWGVGPTMIMPDGMPGGVFPRLQMADGSEVRLHQLSAGVFLSPSFDRYTVATHTLQMASGITAHFDSRGQLTDLVDPFGNVVEVTIDALYRLTQVVQHLGNGQDRVATLAYAEGSVLPLSLTCQGRTWQYTWESQAGAVRLTGVHPPEGPAWTFAYGVESLQNPTRIEHTLTVTLPTGGQVQYGLDPIAWTLSERGIRCPL